jgi:hypothetical protein
MLFPVLPLKWLFEEWGLQGYILSITYGFWPILHKAPELWKHAEERH